MDADSHTGVLILWDLENCRLPEKEDVCELVRRIKSMFVDPKSPQKLLGFVVGISHTVKLGKQAQDLRYSGVQMRRCLGKWAGKNEEAESYLISEYNYVKSILRTAAGKQLKHLVLIGGDADCKSLLEAAQADGVQCEMMYQPMAVGSSYLRGETARGTKCYDYFAVLGNLFGREVTYTSPEELPGGVKDVKVHKCMPGCRELYTYEDGTPAQPSVSAPPPAPAAEQAGPSHTPATTVYVDEHNVHFQSAASQHVQARLFLSGGFFLGGTNASERFQCLEEATDSTVWHVALSKTFRTANSAVAFFARFKLSTNSNHLAVKLEYAQIAQSGGHPEDARSPVQLVQEHKLQGKFRTTWLVQALKPDELKVAQVARHHVLEGKASCDLSKVLLDGIAARISIPGTGVYMTAGSGSSTLNVVCVPEGHLPSEPSSIFWLSGARGCQIAAAVRD